LSYRDYNATMPQAAAPNTGEYMRGSQVEAVRERPSARAIILLIAIFVLPVSLIPATRGIMFRLPLLPHLWWKVNLLILFAMLVLTYRALGGFSHAISRSTRRCIVWPILALGMLQVVSLLWNERDGLMRTYSFLQTACMCAAVLCGVLLSSGFSYSARLKVGVGITLLIAFVFSIYVGLSFVFPSWRPSAAWKDLTAESLGFIRVRGPLGTATTLNFVLVPALGFSIGMAFLPSVSRYFWGVLALFFVVSILSTGSRGGALSLAIFAVLLLLSLRLRSLMFLLPVAIVLSSPLLFTGIPERFRNLEDHSRFKTNATALRTFAAGPRNIMVGAGHGAIYSTLHDQTLRRLHRKDRWYLFSESTPFGYTLRSSHTAILRTLAETGVLGCVLFLIPLIWMLWHLLAPRFQSIRDAACLQAKCALAGCAAMIPYMAFDEFFVSAFWLVLLWTMFVVVATENAAETGVPELSERGG